MRRGGTFPAAPTAATAAVAAVTASLATQYPATNELKAGIVASTNKRKKLTNKNEAADRVSSILTSFKMLQDDQLKKTQLKLMQAGIRTKAEKVGDHFVVNGQKTWTTLGQWANWIFCLVRTDFEAKKQRGISFLLIDLDSPGVTVRPIQLIDGGHEVPHSLELCRHRGQRHEGLGDRERRDALHPLVPAAHRAHGREA